MFEFLNSVISYIASGFNYLIGIVTTAFKALEFLGKSITLPYQVAGYMPSLLGSAVVCFFAVYALKFLFGR